MAQNLFQMFPGLKLGPQGPGAQQIATGEGLAWANTVTGADGKTYRIEPDPTFGQLKVYDLNDQKAGGYLFGNDGTFQNWAPYNDVDSWGQQLMQLGVTAGAMAFGMPYLQGGEAAAGAGLSGMDMAADTAGFGGSWAPGAAAGGTGAMGAGASGIAPSVGLTPASVGAGAGGAVPEVAASTAAAGGGAASSSPWYSGLAAKAGGMSAGDWGAVALKYGAPVVGSMIGSNAAKDAANTQAAATDRANALLQSNLDRTRGDLEPWRTAGAAASGALSQKLGTGGNPNAADYGSLTRQFTGADLASDPGYQFGLNQGQQALDRKAAAGGSYFSGNALKAAAQYGNDYAGTKFNEAFARDQASKGQTYNFLSGASGLGENAAAMTGNLGAQAVGQMSNNTTAQGTATGAAQIAQGNAWSNGLTNVYGNYMQGQQMDQQNALMRAVLGGNAGWR